jgi:hypothetical protein
MYKIRGVKDRVSTVRSMASLKASVCCKSKVDKRQEARDKQHTMAHSKLVLLAALSTHSRRGVGKIRTQIRNHVKLERHRGVSQGFIPSEKCV